MGNDIRAARDIVGYGRLWFGYFGGAAAWTAFHLFGYLWAATYCGTMANVLIIATTAITSLITIAAFWVCYTNEKALRDMPADSPGAFRYLLRSGIYLNLIFLITIVPSGIAIWFLRACPA